nr:MAG: hypothetical protein [Bacteriophage sp.]
MIPVTQFILGNSDPLLYPSEKMTNSIDEQIAFLQSQKQAINEAYRRNAIPVDIMTMAIILMSMKLKKL